MMPFLTEEAKASPLGLEQAAEGYLRMNDISSALRVYQEAEKQYIKARNFEAFNRCSDKIRALEIITCDE
jgi:hypothetical protein